MWVGMFRFYDMLLTLLHLFRTWPNTTQLTTVKSQHSASTTTSRWRKAPSASVSPSTRTKWSSIPRISTIQSESSATWYSQPWFRSLWSASESMRRRRSVSNTFAAARSETHLSADHESGQLEPLLWPAIGQWILSGWRSAASRRHQLHQHVLVNDSASSTESSTWNRVNHTDIAVDHKDSVQNTAVGSSRWADGLRWAEKEEIREGSMAEKGAKAFGRHLDLMRLFNFHCYWKTNGKFLKCEINTNKEKHKMNPNVLCA